MIPSAFERNQLLPNCWAVVLWNQIGLSERKWANLKGEKSKIEENDGNRNLFRQVSKFSPNFLHFPKIHCILGQLEKRRHPKRQFSGETRSIQPNCLEIVFLLVQNRSFEAADEIPNVKKLRVSIFQLSSSYSDIFTHPKRFKSIKQRLNNQDRVHIFQMHSESFILMENTTRIAHEVLRNI